MRLVFILVPAIVAGALVGLLHPMLGLLVLTLVARFGIDLTEPRPERGES